MEICDRTNEELTVSAGPDFETSKDEPVRFVARLDPADPDVEIDSYEWRDEYGNRGGNGGGGQNGELLSTEKSFETELKAGKHTVTLTVEVADGRTLTDTVNVTVRGKGSGAQTDSPPIADAGGCRMVIAEEDTRLNGSGSYDRDGEIESYEWDVDGDGETDVTGETPTARFEELGNRTVELTVTDDDGNTDTDTVRLFVNDRPHAVFDHDPARPNPEEEVTFDAEAATDALDGIERYEWDVDGDGETDATGETVAHAFETPGDHEVTLTVTDAYGVQNTTATTVHVNHPPTADASNSDQRANVSESLTLDGTASTDPEDGIERYEWDVDGDGEFEKTGATVTHSYDDHGDRNVTLRVTDDGNLTDTDTIAVEVNAPPTARIDASEETVEIGESVAFDGTDSTDPDGEIVAYEWDLDGDGEVDATGPTAEREYDSDASYDVRLTVTDDDGATDTATRTITVLPDEIDDEPGIPAPPDNPDGGSGTGDPHMTTFDGRSYDFQAVGEFVFAQEPDGPLSVQARLDPVSHRPVSVIEAVATSLDGHNVTIDAADETPLVVDGERHELARTDQLDVGNATVFRRGSEYVVVYPGEDGEVGDGDERLTVRMRHNRLDVWLTLDDGRERAVEGLLGTPDEDAPDVALADGTAVSPSDYETLYGEFRDDWRVDSRDESYFHYEDGESPDHFYDPDYPSQLLTVDDLSDDERSAAEQAALDAGLEPGTAAFENAVLDYATTEDDSYLESAATSRPANATFAVEAGSSFEAAVGDDLTLAPTVRNESAENVDFDWRFGDGETATGEEVTHAYDETGTYTVTVTATGPNGGIARDTVTVTVAENATLSQPPIPEVEVTEPNETHARLDASESVDPDGTIAGYAWDVDGDGEVDSYDSTVTVALGSDRTEVSLVVIDDDGNRATESVHVNSPPEADVTASSTTVKEGETVTFDASGSSDPDGDSLTYEWDFDGDGTVDATGETVEHSYADSGTYEATVTVSDDSVSSSTSVSVTVETSSEIVDSFEVSDLSRYSGNKNHFELTNSFAQDGETALGMSSNRYQYHLWLDREPQNVPQRGSTVKFATRIDGGSHYVEYHFGKQSKDSNANGYTVRISTVDGGEIHVRKDGNAVKKKSLNVATGEKYVNEIRWTSTGIRYVVHHDGEEVASLTLSDTAYDSGYIGYGHNDVSPFGENSGIDAYIDYIRKTSD